MALGRLPALGARAAKLSALSIEPSARSQGVGRALAYAGCESYFGAGYRLVYGFYRKSERDLSEFYRSVGFNIARLGERIPVGVGDGYRTVDIGADPDQGMFYIKMSDWKAGRMKPPRGLGR